jgi:hypothetical protein
MNLEENARSIELKLTEKEIFTKFWTSPRLVFKYINENNYNRRVHLLLILAGIATGFDRAESQHLGDTMSLIAILAGSIILGALFGYLTYYIYAALMSWTGKWLKGQGDTYSLLRMLSYAMLPSIIALIPLIPRIALLGKETFESNVDVMGSGSPVIYYVSVLFELILGLWTIVLVIIGISEVQKISIGKSILNLLLPGLVILGPIAIMILLVKFIS